MDFLSMEPITIPYSELIHGYYKLKGEGSHNISFDKSLVISCRHTYFTFLILCIKELNDKDVIDIFEKWTIPTIGLPYKIVIDKMFFLCQQNFMIGQTQLEVGITQPLYITLILMAPWKERTGLLCLC